MYVKRVFCIATMLTSGFMVSPAFAGSVAGTGGSTEVTQILNNMELINTNLQQAKQVEIALRQAATLGNIPWSQTSQSLIQLGQVVNKGMALGYELGGLEDRFKSVYKDYGAADKWKGAFGNWSRSTRDSIMGSLRASGLQAQDFQTEAGLMDNLRSMSGSAAGQMQAVQAGNAIAVEMVGQMQKLRQLSVAQNQAHNAYLLAQQAKDDLNNEAMGSFMGTKRPVTLDEIRARRKAAGQ
ncbi:P-type conjugative transfer protein TrbJ [Chromobacterium vaccinii]|uniref:P-type conjugative transfer protein TrbJ n=1 Tax=Chromobacterium vaccinii TaxID=1108595 RepID=UPI003C739D9E